MYSADKRWRQLGESLVNYSAAVKPGERVMIAMGELESFPLVQAVYEAVLQAGGFPQVQFLSERLRHSVLKYGNEEQIGGYPQSKPMAWNGPTSISACVVPITCMSTGISPPTVVHEPSGPGQGFVLALGADTVVPGACPNADFAAQAGTDLRPSPICFSKPACATGKRKAPIGVAGLTSWKKLPRFALSAGRQISASRAGTQVDRRGWQDQPAGRRNLQSPIPEIEGEISFEFPGVLSGRLVHDIRLRWKQGRLAEARSSSNQEFLQAILKTDPGASSVGEFGIRTNPAVTIFCQDILIDKKIGGTAHIALGRAYPECGGTNQSAIHWDIIKDLRTEGAVYADGKPVLAKGLFLI